MATATAAVKKAKEVKKVKGQVTMMKVEDLKKIFDKKHNIRQVYDTGKLVQSFHDRCQLMLQRDETGTPISHPLTYYVGS